MNVPSYSAYGSLQDTGIDWMPNAPIQWLVKPIGAVAKVVSVTTRPDLELLSVYLDQGVVRFSDVEEKRTNATSSDLSKYQVVKPGNLVLNNQQAWRGSVGVSKYEGIVSPAYIVLSLSDDFDPIFANYYFRTSTTVSHFLLSSKGVGTIQRNLYWQALKRCLVVIPPITEQRAIAAYLDEKCVKLDEAVRIKEEQITLLRERRQNLIQHAVTRGLNPDAPMKDSGIHWIGDIPAHWEMRKLRDIGRLQNGISEGADYFGSGHPFVTYGDIFNNDILPKSPSGLAASSKRDQEIYSVQRGDIFFTRTSEVVSEIGIASTCTEDIEGATFSGFLIRLRPVKGVIASEYARFLFRSNYVRDFFAREVNIVTRASLSQDLLKSLPVFVPPPLEQLEIAEKLFSITKQIDVTISIKQDQIAALKEYKTSLINAAVTGKIKVI